MDEKRKHFSYKSHPYRPTHSSTLSNSGNSLNHQQNNIKKSWKKYEILNESIGKIFIHPSSIYDEVFPKFQQPFEIGIILSESKKKNF